MVFLRKLRRNSSQFSSKVGEGSEEESGVTSSPLFNLFVRPCTAEFLGSIFYVFIANLCLPIDKNEQPLGTTVILALSQGITSGSLILAFGHISGGYFNPVITIAACIGGGVHVILAIFFAISQFFGAFIGALLARGVVNHDVYMAADGGVSIVNQDQSTKGKVIGLELMISFSIALAYLLTGVDADGSTLEVTALTVGGIVTVGTLVAYPISTASFNPAKSIASAVSYSIFAEEGIWEYHYAYWVGPIVGAVLAGLAYRLLLARDRNRIIFRR